MKKRILIALLVIMVSFTAFYITNPLFFYLAPSRTDLSSLTFDQQLQEVKKQYSIQFVVDNLDANEPSTLIISNDYVEGDHKEFDIKGLRSIIFVDRIDKSISFSFGVGQNEQESNYFSKETPFTFSQYTKEHSIGNDYFLIQDYIKEPLGMDVNVNNQTLHYPGALQADDMNMLQYRVINNLYESYTSNANGSHLSNDELQTLFGVWIDELVADWKK